MKLNSLESVYQYYVKDVYRYLYSSLMITMRPKTWYRKPFTALTCSLRIGRMNESSHGYFGSPITLMSIISARPAEAS